MGQTAGDLGRRSPVSPRLIASAAMAALALAGCGQSDPAARSATPSTAVPASYPAAGGEQEYETWATVLQQADGPARLCIQGTLDSLPPQCAGGPRITNWDWEAVPEPDQRGGTRWAEYHVRGTYDGDRFTLTVAPRPGTPDEDWYPDPDGDRPTIPCPEPDGGWAVTDPTKVDDEHALIATAKAEPDFVDLWFNDLDEPSDNGYQDLSKGVFTVTFTGDLARHEAQLRSVWGGPLCVWLGTPAKVVADALSDRVQADVDAGWFTDTTVLGWGTTGTEGRFRVSVMVAPDDLATRLAERYGVPVEVIPALRPVT